MPNTVDIIFSASSNSFTAGTQQAENSLKHFDQTAKQVSDDVRGSMRETGRSVEGVKLEFESFDELAEAGHGLHHMFRELHNVILLAETAKVVFAGLSAIQDAMGDSAEKAAEGEREFYNSLKELPIVGSAASNFFEGISNFVAKLEGHQTLAEMEEDLKKDKEATDEYTKSLKELHNEITKLHEKALLTGLSPEEAEIQRVKDEADQTIAKLEKARTQIITTNGGTLEEQLAKEQKLRAELAAIPADGSEEQRLHDLDTIDDDDDAELTGDARKRIQGELAKVHIAIMQLQQVKDDIQDARDSADAITMSLQSKMWDEQDKKIMEEQKRNKEAEDRAFAPTLSRAKALISESEGPAEKLSQQIDDLTQAYNHGAIGFQDWANAVAHATAKANEEINKLHASTKQLFEEVKTPDDKMKEKMDALNADLKDHKITTEEWIKLAKQARKDRDDSTATSSSRNDDYTEIRRTSYFTNSEKDQVAKDQLASSRRSEQDIHQIATKIQNTPATSIAVFTIP